MRKQQAQFEASLENLESIVTFVSRFMEGTDLTEEQVYNIEISVDEHISNLIEHAFEKGSDRVITIICCDDDAKAQVIIADKSEGFDPRQHSIPDFDGKTIYEIPPGGLGNYFICKLMDDVEYIHRPYVENELILTMLKATTPSNSA